METEDPRAALGAKDVTTRSAAARDLALVGGVEDLETLVQMALADKSSAVRLYAAAAAADIVSRLGADGLSAEQRAWIDKAVGGVDPAANPSLLMLWSMFPEKAVIGRLVRMLRDPRNAVRAGAVVALRRMAVSAGAMELPVLEVLIGETLTKRPTPDVTLEVVRMAGELGWTHSDDLIRKVAGQSEQIREAVDEAFRRNQQRAAPDTYAGFWIDRGLDVGVAGEPAAAGWLAIVDGRVESSDGSKGAVKLGDDGAVEVLGEPARLLWAAPPGGFYDRQAVLQTAEHAWWRQAGDALVELLDTSTDRLPAQAYQAMRADLDAIEGQAGVRARLVAAWGAGDLDLARAEIDELTSKKKPRNDLWWWRGRIYADLGDARTAREALGLYLDKAKKGDPRRAEAEALLAELG